jgi:chitinase
MVGKVKFISLFINSFKYLFFILYIGVTSRALNGYSQPASSNPPPGTWEPGDYDYDDIKKNYLPTYTRYWDDESKVPFLFNAEKGMWLSYDDLQSNTVKNNYIVQQKLAGAMFWEFSCDRNVELIGNTYNALFGNQTTTTTATTTTSGDILPWAVNTAYNVGDKVTYNGNIYQCLEAHTSLSTWTPDVAPSLWELVGPAR